MDGNLSRIRAIDLHAHLNHGAGGERPANPLSRADPEFLRRMYDYAGVSCGVFSTFASVLSAEHIREENDFLRTLCAGTDWIYQWAVVDPRQADTLEQAELLLPTDRCLGLKLHPKYHGYDLTEYIRRVFGFADQRRTAVLIHPIPEEQFGVLVEAADRFPHMKLIIAHLGSTAHVEAIRSARHRNIYTDTSGQAMKMNYVLEYAVARVGSERIFFGTDTYSSAFQRGRIEYAMLPDRDKENILRLNALREFDKLSGR